MTSQILAPLRWRLFSINLPLPILDLCSHPAKELAASEEAKTVLIERLRYSIDELSNPIVEVWDDVLVMPIIGVVDSRRTAHMVQRLLAEVTRTQASFVIVDLTGVEIVDTKTADHFMRLTRKVEIVGARADRDPAGGGGDAGGFRRGFRAGDDAAQPQAWAARGGTLRAARAGRGAGPRLRRRAGGRAGSAAADRSARGPVERPRRPPERSLRISCGAG